MNDQPSDRAGLPARKPLHKRRRLKELQKEEAQFRAIFESAAFGIVLADAEGRPQDCNPTLERMLGYTADEFRTMRISDFTHPDDAEETERALQALAEGELELGLARAREARVLVRTAPRCPSSSMKCAASKPVVLCQSTT